MLFKKIMFTIVASSIISNALLIILKIHGLGYTNTYWIAIYIILSISSVLMLLWIVKDTQKIDDSRMERVENDKTKTD